MDPVSSLKASVGKGKSPHLQGARHQRMGWDADRQAAHWRDAGAALLAAVDPTSANTMLAAAKDISPHRKAEAAVFDTGMSCMRLKGMKCPPSSTRVILHTFMGNAALLPQVRTPAASCQRLHPPDPIPATKKHLQHLQVTSNAL